MSEVLSIGGIRVEKSVRYYSAEILCEKLKKCFGGK